MACGCPAGRVGWPKGPAGDGGGGGDRWDIDRYEHGPGPMGWPASKGGPPQHRRMGVQRHQRGEAPGVEVSSTLPSRAKKRKRCLVGGHGSCPAVVQPRVW